ncbi:rifin PIR protein,putative [Plasmodium sp. DRC-Itaito]|nr:rifin PIR protein,putative [Plasmodium sp. DRC-Itaito]
MKLHCSKIYLLFLALNILVTSYQVYSKNKPSITSHHTPIYTSRVLSECDTETSIYDKDEEMKSVKEKFERQTSQRFEEYEERMKVKRQKRKEQRDKNIQKIIHKDKMEKNLAEKIEKGCLRCGCGLGGVAGSIGLFGGIAINMWKPAALKIAIDKAIAAGATKIAEAAEAARILAGKEAIIAGLKKMGILTLDNQLLESYFATTPYNTASVITQAVYNQYVQTCKSYSLGRVGLSFFDTNRDSRLCQLVLNQTFAASKTGKGISDVDVMKTAVKTMMSEVEGVAKAAAEAAEAAKTATIKATQEKAIEAASTHLYTTIGHTILAILIIVLIMVIIYLILRRRRKKKMQKKLQYIKLLEE